LEKPVESTVSSRTQDEADFAAMFLALLQLGKADALATMIHRETIRAREAYVPPDASIPGISLRRSNEYVHCLAGQALAVLRGTAGSERDASLMVIEATAEHSVEELDWLRTRLCGIREAYGAAPPKLGTVA